MMVTWCFLSTALGYIQDSYKLVKQQPRGTEYSVLPTTNDIMEVYSPNPYQALIRPS